MTQQATTTVDDQRHPVALFKAFYERSRGTRAPSASELYVADVVFEDPIHRLQNLDDLEAYLRRFDEVVTPRRFVFGEQLVGGRSAMLTWTMEFDKTPQRTITVAGVTHLRFGAKITHHRNYYDTRSLTGEKLSLLTRAKQLIKRK